MCQELGLPSIFREIFQEEVVDDLVSLHCMLFSIQYATARCWLDGGLKVELLIGHSFGQLTALSIAGSISCKDALRLISGRARLFQEQWGKEPGAMLSVECDRQDIESLVGLFNSQNVSQVDFACYNGPRAFVLAGDTSSIEKLEKACSSPEFPYRFKMMRLKNSRAYHSHLADGIIPALKKLADSIDIREPSIPVETCSKDGNWLHFTAEEVSKHTRQPVYFVDAVERITARLPSAVWLEAGSMTPIINMTRKILSSRSNSNTFIPTNLGPRDAMKSLANAATQLWLAGSKGHYWPFQGSSATKNTWCDLPPYQFEKVQHWIQYKPSAEVKSLESSQMSKPGESNLVSLVKHDISEDVFSVDTSNSIFQLAARGHAVAGQSLCPASMYIELAARCARAILGDVSGRVPEIEELVMSAPLGLSIDVNVFLRLTKIADARWHFVVLSESQAGYGETEHAKGHISFTPFNDPLLLSQTKLLKQLASNSRSDDILASSLTTGISGSMVYKVFSEVVEYAEYYRGVGSLSGLHNEAVGLVALPVHENLRLGSSVCDPIALDNFLQVAGIHVNCLSDRKSDEVFMCIAVEKILFSEAFMETISNLSTSDSNSWTVYSKYEKAGSKNITNNIFVYDRKNSLVLSIIGAIFRSVPFKSVVKSLSKLNGASGTASGTKLANISDSGYTSGTTSPTSLEERDDKQFKAEDSAPGHVPQLLGDVQVPLSDESIKISQIIEKVREMFAEIIEIPVAEVETTSTLDELGIDSLLVTEVQAEIQKRFNVNITPAEFLQLDDVLSVCQRIEPDSTEQHQKSINGHSKESAPGVAINDSLEYKDNEIDVNQTGANMAVMGHDAFSKVKGTYDQYSQTTGFTNFRTGAFLLQSQLVVKYVVDAFVSLGCDLSMLRAGDKVPMISYIPFHRKVVPQLYKILEAAGLIKDGLRTDLAVPQTPASVLHADMLRRFPQHTSETNLLHTTGQRLADCLSGKADPIGLIFRDATARALLSDVYLNAPMFKAGTMVLARYLSESLETVGGRREIKILELGAGTGGTTEYLLEELIRSKANFTYTFTDLSSSLVMAAKKKFKKYDFMHYTVLDIEKTPEQQFLGQYDIIISTNCIHATKDLVVSTTNIRRMLHPDGILCLCELTRNLFWFDLVFGLLEGWWLFNDGREHVLAHEDRWKHCLNTAGFQWVDWSNSPSEESDILRVITASPFKVTDSAELVRAETNTEHVQETIIFKEADGLALHADIYYPPKTTDSKKKLPVGKSHTGSRISRHSS
jgi:malonyl CoA-acyl carrier protein transacylase/SAM-dependent methyltransferase